MNDITPKEAIENLNHLYGMVAPDIQRSLDVAIKALERPKGAWLRLPNTPKRSYQRLCANCYNTSYFCGDGDYPTCPYCLADMKGGAE